MDTLKNAVQSVMNVISSQAPGTPSISRAQVIELEEQERHRRTDQAAQSHLDQQNAKRVSMLLLNSNFPVLRSSNIGFKRYTHRSEEQERRRRLDNKTEYEIRKFNAEKMAGIFCSLGWPLYRASWQGPQYIIPDQTLELEELERKRRVNNPLLSKTAKNNAASVSGIARWAHFKKNPLAGSKRVTRNLEEKERKRRLQNSQGLETACEHAYTEARCIRNLGYPFFVQNKETNSAISELNSIEEKERARRLSDTAEQAQAKKQAHKLTSLIPTTDVISLEDKERGRRLLDFQGQQLAKENATKVSSLIAATNVDFLEDKERERRMNSLEEQAAVRENARKVSELVSASQQGNRFAYLDSLESHERARRLANPMEQLYSRQNALKVSGFVSQAGFQRDSSLSNLHRSENGLDVGSLVVQPVTFTSNTLELVNAERERRISDVQSREMAHANALKVSNLLRTAYKQAEQKSLSSFDIELGFPASTIAQQSAQPVSSSDSFSALPCKSRNLMQKTAMQQAGASTFIPITQPQATPTATSVAPVAYAMSAESVTPAPSFIAPIASNITPVTSYVTPTYTAVVPPVSRGLATASVHSDKERKVLAKEASKHAKLASKESRKAEHEAAKAEQLLTKGKDSRAARHEASAEQHALAAKHHQQWAQDAQLLAGSAANPSLITTTGTVYRPAM